MHTLLASGTTVEFLFHMLQKQIAQNYADPKLIEMLVYLVQAIARFDRTYGKTSYCAEIGWRYESESPVDVDSFRNWLETREIDFAKHTPSKEVSGWLRDALWQEVQVTECPSQCPEPQCLRTPRPHLEGSGSVEGDALTGGSDDAVDAARRPSGGQGVSVGTGGGYARQQRSAEPGEPGALFAILQSGPSSSTCMVARTNRKRR